MLAMVHMYYVPCYYTDLVQNGHRISIYRESDGSELYCFVAEGCEEVFLSFQHLVRAPNQCATLPVPMRICEDGAHAR